MKLEASFLLPQVFITKKLTRQAGYFDVIGRANATLMRICLKLFVIGKPITNSFNQMFLRLNISVSLTFDTNK